MYVLGFTGFVREFLILFIHIFFFKTFFNDSSSETNTTSRCSHRILHSSASFGFFFQMQKYVFIYWTKNTRRNEWLFLYFVFAGELQQQQQQKIGWKIINANANINIMYKSITICIKVYFHLWWCHRFRLFIKYTKRLQASR